MRTVTYSKFLSSHLNSHFNTCRITSKLKLSSLEFFYFQNSNTSLFSTSKTISRHVSPHSAPKKNNVTDKLSKTLHKTLLEQKEEQTTKRKGYLLLFEEALGVKSKWSKDLLSDLLLRFKSSTEIKKKSLELGLSPSKFKKVMQKFVGEVWDNNLTRCKTEDLQSAFDANGVKFLQFISK